MPAKSVTLERPSRKRIITLIALGIVGVMLVGACTNPGQSKSAQDVLQNLSEQIFQRANKDQYPLGAITGPTAEVKNVSARIVRFNDPNKIGYLAEFSNDGKVLEVVTIKGKVSSTGSQLTNTDNINYNGGNGGGNVVTRSIGDDGTYGPEECEGNGIFYFRADNNAIEEFCGQLWKYSDAPFTVTTPPVINVIAGQGVTTAIPAGGSPQTALGSSQTAPSPPTTR